MRRRNYQLNLLLVKRQKNFLFFFNSLFFKIFNILDIFPLESNNHISIFFKRILSRLTCLLETYNSLFLINNNYKKLIKNVQKNLKKIKLFSLELKRSKYLLKKKLNRKFYRKSQKIKKHSLVLTFKHIKTVRFNKMLIRKNISLYKNLPTITLRLYKEIYLLFLKLKLEELQFNHFTFGPYKTICNISLTPVEIASILSCINENANLLLLQSIILKKKIKKYIYLYIRRIFLKQKIKIFLKYNSRIKKYIPKPTSITYFLLNKKYKKKRRLTTFRLKPVHLALPQYLYFDFKTLQAVFLYTPTSNQIHYSFKCSLTKLTSFYKSLAL